MSVKAHPFLKWVGGKRQLLPELIRRIPKEFGVYHEPFLGGGALFFELSARQYISQAWLSDINLPLIETYEAVAKYVEDVISILKHHKYNRDYYYKIRSLDTSKLTTVERAARIIYLNKTCFNGLYRENSKGIFNVPFGDYDNPVICDEDNLRAASEALCSCILATASYHHTMGNVNPGDFVYFDPPYYPTSKTANFSSYDKKGFGTNDHIELRDVFKALDAKGVKVLLSNSDTPFVRHIYKGYKINRVYATRSVNSKGSKRGKVAELLIRNY